MSTRPNNTHSTSDQPTIGQRIRDWMKSTPIFTRNIILICFLLYIYQLIFNSQSPPAIMMFSPIMILEYGQLWRLFTGAFFHLGFLHILFNMLAMFSLGHPLERMAGSLVFAWINVLFMITSAALHSLVAITWFWISNDPSMYHSFAVGYSGVLFALLVLRTKMMPDGISMLCGYIPVRNWFYPWALLLLISGISLLLSSNSPGGNVSFMGHLAGILVGYGYCHKVFDIFMPSMASFQKMEASFCCRSLEARENCIRTMSSTPLRGDDPVTCFTMIYNWYRGMNGWSPLRQDQDNLVDDENPSTQMPQTGGRRIGTGPIPDTPQEEAIEMESYDQGMGDNTNAPDISTFR